MIHWFSNKSHQTTTENEMNAPANQAYFQPKVQGELLFSGFQLTDTLMVDLYGSLPTEDDGYIVEGVALAGQQIDIAVLLRAEQLDDMGQWLDFKDDTNPTLRRVAEQKKHAVMRPY